MKSVSLSLCLCACGPLGGISADGKNTIPDGVPFMEASTFEGSLGCTGSRDGSEIEATFAVLGADALVMRDILHSASDPDDTSDDPDTVWEDIRRNRDLEAFTMSYSLTEIPWSRKHHEIRQAFPYLPLSIESGNFEIEGGDGVADREISLGADINDDVYYDTDNFDMVDDGVAYRARVRWDNEGSMRRMLIAAKEYLGVDDLGIKRSAKIDARTSNSSHRTTLETDAQRGTTPWCSNRAFSASQFIYERMDAKGITKDMTDSQGEVHEGVLMVEPKAYLRSFRSRYHLNRVSFSQIARVYDNALDRVDIMVADAEALLVDPDRGLTSAERGLLEAVVADGEALVDGQVVLDAIQALSPDAQNIALPRDFSQNVSTQEQLDLNEASVAVAAQMLSDFAELVDDVDRIVSDAENSNAPEDLAEAVVDWQDQENTTLARDQTYAAHAEALNGYDVADWGRFQQHLEALAAGDGSDAREAAELLGAFDLTDPLVWDEIRRQMVHEEVKVTERMISLGATMAHSLWFAQAEQFYVGVSSSSSSNFLIDTMDFTEMLTPAAWRSIDPDARDRTGIPLPSDQILHATVVNEVQIELELEQPYMDRIAQLEADIAALQEVVAGPDVTDDVIAALAEKEVLLSGAYFVFNTLLETQSGVATLKGDDILEVLEEAGAGQQLEWGKQESKGEIALSLVR